MKSHASVLVFVPDLGTRAVPAPAQGHHKSFTGSTYAIQGTVPGPMNGRPDLGPSAAYLLYLRRAAVLV